MDNYRNERTTAILILITLACLILSGIAFNTVVASNYESHRGDVLVVCYEASVKTIGNRTWCEIVEKEELID